jgi:hypothetical protein
MPVCFEGFEADVEIPCRLDAFVAEDAAHEFVIARIFAQEKRRRRMPELVAGHANSDVVLHGPGDPSPKTVEGAHRLVADAGKEVFVSGRNS